MKKLIVLFAVLATAACGVPDSKLLKDLTAEEQKALCGEIKEETKECDGVEITRSAGDCEDNSAEFPDDCQATVGDARACNQADLCELGDNAGCQAITECFTG